MILIDRSRGAARVLMGRRHADHVFMPDRLVFPGGRVEASDKAMPAYGTLGDAVERRLSRLTPRPSQARARALALCAIRETAEETGLLLGETGLGSPPSTHPEWAPFVAHAVFPNLEALHLVARAITPPGHVRRFDARFFAADRRSVAVTIDNVVGPGAELVSLEWLTIAEALRADTAEITRSILREVEAKLAVGLERDAPVPFFREWRGRWRRDEIA